MKLKDMTIKNKIEFEDIKLGTVFRFNGKYYMRINEVAGNNAVCLENGIIVKMSDTDTVTIMDAELLIKKEVI